MVSNFGRNIPTIGTCATEGSSKNKKFHAPHTDLRKKASHTVECSLARRGRRDRRS